MMIFSDIGGTYARFGAVDGKNFVHFKRYEARNFDSFEAALGHYLEDCGLEMHSLRIATAAYPDSDARWRFVNNNQWVIDPAVLSTEIILNDFEAATLGLKGLVTQTQNVLKAGAPETKCAKCLMGPGTGLGLGYLSADGVVQKTHGGHMVVSALSEEHRDIIRAVQSLKAERTIPVFENFVSGPGLYNLYRGVCALKGVAVEVSAIEGLFTLRDDECVKDALRLFHQFFGLFAHMAVVSGHAYGGLYLTGGVLDRLVEQEMFDFTQFEKFFVLDGVSSVKQAIDNTPVIQVRDPYLSFRGLRNA